MIVKYSTLQNLEIPKFTLCNPGSEFNNGLLTKVVGILTDHEAEEIVFNFNSTSELNLRINKVKREDPDENEHTYKLYKNIQNRRLIFVEDIGYFMITKVDDDYDGNIHYKDVKAESIDIEISQKMVPYISDGTYRFSTDKSKKNKGILETIVETLPLWTIGEVDNTIASKFRTFEDVDPSLNCLAFLLEKVQDAYECIIIFDCINRIINVYSQDNYVKQTDIHITKNDLINSLEIIEDAEDLYTAMSVFGDDDITISAINPLGSNVIYNFTHYLDWMSSGLGKKVKQWQDEIASKFTTYYNHSLNYYKKLSDISECKMEIEKLSTQIKMYRRCQNNIVAEASTSLVESYNKVITDNGGTPITICSEITETLLGITALILQCESRLYSKTEELNQMNNTLNIFESNIEKINQELSISNYFLEEELAELSQYIFEGSYKDEYVTITDIMTYSEKLDQMKTLYDRAKIRLDKVSSPSQEFNIDVENFIFVKEFEQWSEQLETGCLINVELESNDVAQLFLSNITINYEDKNLNMKFGNRFNKFDPKSLFEDMLGDISKSTNTLSYIKDILYPIKNGELNAMQQALQTSRNLSMGAALSSNNEEVVIDGSGYTGKKLLESGVYDPRQVKLTGKNLVFTDDAWESCKVAIGELEFGNGDSAYGVNAKAIIGDIIIGNNIRIIDKYGNDAFSVIDDKISSSVGTLGSELDGIRTSLEQNNEEINIRIDKIEKSEVDRVTTSSGYTFDENGLSIYKSGDDIKNLLDNTGMYVTRGIVGDGEGEEILTANNEGVSAINLTARQYFIAGTNSRFEDYSNGTDTKRTACFYIGN